MVLLQTLLVDGDLYGIASETVDGIYKHDIPRHRFFAVRQHLLKSGAMVVRSRHGSVDIGI